MEFNYVIGRYWEGTGGSICAYTLMSSSVHYGTLDEAEEMLKYINNKSEEQYKIFKVEDL